MNSIRRRLSRNLLALTLVLLGGGVGALYFAARDAAIEQFDFTLRAKAMALSTMTVPTVQGVVVEFNDHFFPGFEAKRPRDFFEIWNSDAAPLARSESLEAHGELPRQLGTITKPEYWNLRLPTHRAGRAIGFTFQPTVRGKAQRGGEPSVALVVASDRGELDETLWSLLAIAGGCALLLIAATLWLVPRVLRKGLRPLDQLAHETAQIDANSLSTRFTVEAMPSELQPIATRLNDLLARLEHSFDRERRFSADLAHELRTPLAELRSLAECALKWPESRDSATDRDTLAIAQQMERLVGFILALARSEDGQVQPTLRLTALDELVRDTWRPFAATASECRLRVSFALLPTSGCADDVLLRSIVSNLLDNAVDYTPIGGMVEIRSGVENGRSVITLSNDAPDIDTEDVPRLFDRFWRKEAARTGGKHVGLGLSLSRSFAEAMGWTLTARHDGQRITFTLSTPLPLDQAAMGAKAL